MMPCPTPDQLQRLLNKQLGAEEYGTLEAHVEECLACRRVLDHLLVSTAPAETISTAPLTDSLGTDVFPTSRYRVQRFHKKGGLGEVHLAEDTELGRPVALKRIRPERGQDPECRQRFLREATLTARLEHPGVVPVHGLVQDPSGQPWYAMRFIDVLALDGQEAAARIRARAIGERLVAALDHWAFLLGETKGQGRNRLQGFARLADPDIGRNDLRDALDKEDLSKLKKLAASMETAALPIPNLILLSKGLVRGKDVPGAVALLRRAILQHPGNFWLNHELAFRLGESRQIDEAIRYYTAALALRPESVTLLTNLGNTLAERGRWDDALAMYQRAIQLKPAQAWLHDDLGGFLYKQGRFDEASAAYRQAIALDPKLPQAHLFLGGSLLGKGPASGSHRHGSPSHRAPTG